MHDESLALMRDLFAKVGGPVNGDHVLDVGSYDVDGSYRESVTGRGAVYTGLDVRPGPNVDVWAPGRWPEMRSFDMAISGQTLEHDPKPWETVHRMAAQVRKGGWVLLIAPREQREHRYPIDCWRFLPDGMRALLANVCERIDAGVVKRDCWGVGRVL
jgi:hypothetical protein